MGGTNIAPSPKINKDQWYHITTTSDDSNVKIYLNGNLVHSYTREYTGSTDRYPLQIGMADNAFVGAIDELKIYNYARTAAQIKSDYEQEAKPTVIIHYQNADGEDLMSPTVHTKTSNGTEFQLGQTYYFDPDDLVSRADGGIYQKPEKQSVVFSQTERMKEITFVYPIKPMLVLHYTFDEGGNTVADSSQLETKNPGTVIGNYTWDEWGRVGGMYKKAQIMP